MQPCTKACWLFLPGAHLHGKRGICDMQSWVHGMLNTAMPASPACQFIGSVSTEQTDPTHRKTIHAACLRPHSTDRAPASPVDPTRRGSSSVFFRASGR
eukprot:360121-Chlamydomonas_euryale.AAC.21